MVIIEVPLVTDSNGAIVYPDDISLFGLTIEDGGNLVGEYNGVLVFPIYAGIWPIPVPPAPTQYETRFRTNVFLSDILTSEETDELLDSTNNLLKKTVKRLTLPNRNAWIDATDPKFVQVIEAMQSDAIIDQARHDELLLGVPI